MSLRLILSISTLFCLVSHVLSAQDLVTTLQQMRDHYAESEQLHLIMDIQAYESDSATNPFFRQQAEVRRAGNHYRYRFQDREVLMNERVSLVVDNAHQLITCQARDLSTEAMLNELPFANLDSLLTAYGEATFLGEDQGTTHYQITRTRGDITRVEVHFDTQKQLTQALSYHYRNGSRVEITFETMNLEPEFSSDTFSETAYVAEDHQGWKLTEEYGEYELVQ